MYDNYIFLNKYHPLFEKSFYKGRMDEEKFTRLTEKLIQWDNYNMEVNKNVRNS